MITTYTYAEYQNACVALLMSGARPVSHFFASSIDCVRFSNGTVVALPAGFSIGNNLPVEG